MNQYELERMTNDEIKSYLEELNNPGVVDLLNVIIVVLGRLK